jgi:antitoxin VapB
MTLHIKDPKADKLARELAAATGESITDAVTKAVEERLMRERSRHDVERRLAEVRKIVEEVKKLPVLDDRPADEILGYNDIGVWDK